MVSKKVWFENFKTRFSLHTFKTQGETGSADIELAREYHKTLAKIIEECGCEAEQIFNAGETGLNSKKCLVGHTSRKMKRLHQVLRPQKTELPLGDYIKKPLFIKRSLNPQALKNIEKSNLSVY